ncbi:MAG: orotidine-5'-phosphate decarboxylase [Candidatus Berkiellales bacterium]
MSTRSKIIIALDYEDDSEVKQLIKKLSPQECRLKVGTTLFTQYGPPLIQFLQQAGFEIFLDLKFHDIPQQVSGACNSAAKLGVWMMNVHALGGLKMLQAAKAAVDKAATSTQKRPLLIGVTLLTSLNQNDIAQFNMSGSLDDNVLHLAALCFEAGLDGVVCSAHEVEKLKKKFGAKFLCVTPGIRLPDDAAHDQQRIMTPTDAVKAGSDYLVMGRSITHAPIPLQVLQQVNQSIIA